MRGVAGAVVIFAGTMAWCFAGVVAATETSEGHGYAVILSITGLVELIAGARILSGQSPNLHD